MRALLGRLLLALLGLLLLALLAAWLLVRGSLPLLHGEQALDGLAAPVRVERDALGTVTIDAGSEADAMRALGYVHAQERYFEMDLMRRSAAGELAELFGPAAITRDRQMRVHRLRTRVDADLDTALGGQRSVLEAYRDGVNAGLGDLRVRPWSYLLLRQAPRAWALDDSVLVALAMYADLQDPANQREQAWIGLQATLPAPLYALLRHDGSTWDAPLLGPLRGDAPLPGAATLDLRQHPAPAAAPGATGRMPSPALAASGIDDAAEARDAVPGSNNFAVAGTLTADGRAILADDMHLSLRAPNIWFRARLRYPDPRAPGGRVDVTGFTLPGLPAVIVGSNGHVAWGFTNSYIDTADFAKLPADATTTQHVEAIRVASADETLLEVEESAWGPVVGRAPDGSRLALRWAAQLPGAVRLDFIDMLRAGDLDQAFAVADRAGIPAQNLLVADSGGRIGWRIIGARPSRAPGCTPDPVLQASTCPPWALRSDAAPALVDPPSQRLWTANNRVVDGATLAEVGDGGYDLGARARQIRDDLFAHGSFSERDLLAIQLDDRALFLQRWWTLLRQVVEHADDPHLQQLERATRQWEGRAAVDSTSYRIVRAFRTATLDAIASGLLAPAKARLGDAYVAPKLTQLEGVAWPLLSERPAHLLPPGHASWDALLQASARQAVHTLAEEHPGALAQRSWGERNTSAICHPIARALPAIATRWLCMPAEPLPGDRDMPRVQGPAFGASERMVVAPGHEADGLVHMPGGQSGHPLSPFWGSGHADWAQGRPTPFLPGPAREHLLLRPR